MTTSNPRLRLPSEPRLRQRPSGLTFGAGILEDEHFLEPIAYAWTEAGYLARKAVRAFSESVTEGDQP